MVEKSMNCNKTKNAIFGVIQMYIYYSRKKKQPNKNSFELISITDHVNVCVLSVPISKNTIFSH